MEKISFKVLSPQEMEKIEGGSCAALSLMCGLGIAASTLTGGIGAIILGLQTSPTI